MLEKSIDKRRCDDALFDVIEAGLTEDLLILREVQDIVVDLESNAQVSAEIEHSPLVFEIKVED